jgi:hypothetical protein
VTPSTRREATNQAADQGEVIALDGDAILRAVREAFDLITDRLEASVIEEDGTLEPPDDREPGQLSAAYADAPAVELAP